MKTFLLINSLDLESIIEPQIVILKIFNFKICKQKEGKMIFACFVNLLTAFDTLWHNGLRYKLKENGLGKFFL